MANQPDKNKRMLSLRISREFYRRLQKDAADRKMKFNEYIRFLIYDAVEDVELTEKDYEQIKRERDAYIERQNSKRRLPKD